MHAWSAHVIVDHMAHHTHANSMQIADSMQTHDMMNNCDEHNFGRVTTQPKAAAMHDVTFLSGGSARVRGDR
jgi:hypothetical protein